MLEDKLIRNHMKISEDPSGSEYSPYPHAIDITMGEFAFSDFYPLHSSSYATCMGVVVGAVEGYGVCLGHLDPAAGNTASFYKRSLDQMITTLLKKSQSLSFDLLFFQDGYGASLKYNLPAYVASTYSQGLRCFIDRTEGATGKKYSEVIAMSGFFYSAEVYLKPDRVEWDAMAGKKSFYTAPSGSIGNNVARQLGRAREVIFVNDGKMEAEVK